MILSDAVDRGVEAGAASGSLIGAGLGIVATLLFFAFSDFWRQAGAPLPIVILIATLFSIIAIIGFLLAGITLGAGLGVFFSLTYLKLPGKPGVLKGTLIGLISWPIFLLAETVSHFLGKTLTVDALLSDFWWPLLASVYGILHGTYWKRLDQPDRITFLQKFQKAHPRSIFDIPFVLLATTVVLSFILIPYSIRLGYTGLLPAFVTDPGSVIWIIVFLALLVGLYALLGHTAWIESKLARLKGRNKP